MEKEEVTLSLFARDMILFVEKPKESTEVYQNQEQVYSLWHTPLTNN